MNVNEHYSEAEQLLSAAETEPHAEMQTALAARATAHATIAMALMVSRTTPGSPLR